MREKIVLLSAALLSSVALLWAATAPSGSATPTVSIGTSFTVITPGQKAVACPKLDATQTNGTFTATPNDAPQDHGEWIILAPTFEWTITPFDASLLKFDPTNEATVNLDLSNKQAWNKSYLISVTVKRAESNTVTQAVQPAGEPAQSSIQLDVLNLEITPAYTNACICDGFDLVFRLTNSFAPQGVTWSLDPQDGSPLLFDNDDSCDLISDFDMKPGQYTLTATSLDYPALTATAIFDLLNVGITPARTNVAPGTNVVVCFSLSTNSYAPVGVLWEIDADSADATIDDSGNVTLHSEAERTYTITAISLDNPDCFDTARLCTTKVGVELWPAFSTEWLAVEDPGSPGYGPDETGKPIQKAENEAFIYYYVRGTAEALAGAKLVLTLGCGYKQVFPATLGEGIAIIATKDGKLKGTDDNKNEKWYENAFHDPGWAHRPKIELWLKDATAPCDSDVYGRDEHFYIAPLMRNLKFSPDIVGTSSGGPQSLCPYSDQVTVSSSSGGWLSNLFASKTNGYGLAIDYSIMTVSWVSDLAVKFTGGDAKNKSLQGLDRYHQAGKGYHIKWEGFDADVVEDAGGIVHYPDEMPNGERAPEHVVKEGDGYHAIITVKQPDDPPQMQTFDIPFKVKYKTQ